MRRAAASPAPAAYPADYRQFLAAKVALAQPVGMVVDEADLNPALKPLTRAIVRWALLGGRRAIFASFGLHKTATQIEIMRLIGRRLPGSLRLIVLPLGVRPEFFKEAARRFAGAHAVTLKFIRSAEALEGPGTIYLTNYETIRDGKLDPQKFAAASLDEASILRSFGGTKTFREFMRLFEGLAYKFVATATPSPNQYIELLAYAAFLDIMDVGQAKTRFFKRNSEKADTLTIHPHKEREFWMWVASWGLFVQKPSDLGFSDEGYDLPGLDVHWHEIPSDHSHAGAEKSGQLRLLANSAASLSDAAREKRGSLEARVAYAADLIAARPDEHAILWHGLEDERHALDVAIPGIRSVYGSQDLEEREALMAAFAEGRLKHLGGKLVMLGSGGNFQAFCAWEIFVGIDCKFNDFVQGLHRVFRFGQTRKVRIDIIYTEAERPSRDRLEAKWTRHQEQMAIMTELIREFGLSNAAMAATLTRAMGVERVAVSGPGYAIVNADCVEETRRMGDASVDLIVTSIPFSTQYEYSPNYADFGHTDDNDHFWAQMDFLIPQLLRVLAPGRVAAIHVKDRITPGGINGLGFQTVEPFSDQCVRRFQQHGFAFLARKTIVTDVVRENNQTYRLGWSEQCKDGSRMGAGMPEYLLVFRKPPTDRSDGYADRKVTKTKRAWSTEAKAWSSEGYSRARWQLDAHGLSISNGDRFLRPEEIVGLDANEIYKVWKDYNLHVLYDFEHHVKIAEALEEKGSLPSTFMLVPPHSKHPDVWTDIARMRTMNMLQAATGREMHLCPLQFDIVDRAIAQYSMPGETVFDPFGGLMTVPYCAIRAGRKGVGIELNAAYFLDGAGYLAMAAAEMATPSLLDLMDEMAADPAMSRPGDVMGVAANG